MTLPESLRKTLFNVLAVPGKLGLNEYSIVVIKTSWSGERTSVGTKTVVSQSLCYSGSQNPYFERLSSRQIFAGKDKYKDGDYSITLPRTFISGGYSNSDFELNAPGTTMYFKVLGPDMAPSGTLFSKIDEQTNSLTIKLILRAT